MRWLQCTAAACAAWVSCFRTAELKPSRLHIDIQGCSLTTPRALTSTSKGYTVHAPPARFGFLKSVASWLYFAFFSKCLLDMLSVHGLVSSIQITVFAEEDHMTPSGRDPFPLTTAISGGNGRCQDLCPFLEHPASMSRSNCTCQSQAKASTSSLTLGVGTFEYVTLFRFKPNSCQRVMESLYLTDRL